MKLYWGNDSRKTFIKEANSKKEINSAIQSFLTDKKIEKSPYYRYWKTENGVIMIDYGSWSNYFFIYESESEI